MLICPYIDSGVAELDWDAAVRYHFKDMFPYYVFIKKNKNEMTDYSASMIEGIKESIRYYDMQKEEYNTTLYGKGFYYFGINAYDQWVEDLNNFDGFSEQEKENLRFFTWWNAICVMDKKTAMSKVFREVKAFGNRIQKNIERIKEIKEHEVNLHEEFLSITNPYDI